MKIKDLIEFRLFQGAKFIDYRTDEIITNQEKEIEDIHCIGMNEQIEKIDKYFYPRHSLIVYLTLKED